MNTSLTRHAATIIGMVFIGGLTWNNLNRDVTDISDRSKDNEQAIGQIDGRLDTIERKQDVTQERINVLKDSIDREREDARDARIRIENSLNRIFDTVDKNPGPVR